MSKQKIIPALRNYLLAVLIMVIASAIRAVFLAGLGRGIPYVIYYPAVVLAALFGGLSAGFLATALSFFLTFFWIQQGYLSPAESLGMAIFLLGCILITLIAERLRRTNAKLQVEVAERKQAETALKDKVEDLRRLATVVSDSNDAVIMHDLDGKIMAWNRGAQEIYGYTEAEALGKNVREIVAESDREAALTLIQKIKQGEIVKSFELRRLTKDGRVLDVWLTTTLLMDEKGSPVAIATTERDITERKQAEESLRHSESRFRQMANSLPELVWTCQPDGQCDFLSQQWVDFTGIPEEPQLGFGWLDQLHPEDRQTTVAEWEKAFNSDMDFHMEFRIRRHDGVYRWFDTQAVRARDEAGQTIKWFGSNSDITERKQAEEAAQFLASIVDSTDDAIIGKSLDGIILSWNPGAEKLYGYPAQEAIGKPISIIAIPEKPEEMQEILGKVSRGEKIEYYETVRLTRDGKRIAVSLTISPIHDLDGRIVAASTIGRNITERKQAEEAAQFLASIVNSTDDAIIGKSLDGIILSWNPGAEKLYGYSAQEAIGKPISIIALPEQLDEMQEILGKVSRGEKIEYYETVRLTRDGEQIDVSLTVFPVRDRDGRIVAASMIGRDITERKQAEEKLRATAAELGRSNQELEQFAYIASHDLQEPLRMVSSYMQLIAKRYQGKLDSDADEFIAYAVDGALRMQELINDLLAFSRAGTRGKPFQLINTEAVLNAALENLKLAIDENHARITHDPLPSVLADESQLAQVFQNLIGNAFKFHGEEPPRVHVSARKTSGFWEFSVRDNGIGIDPQFFERVFLIFQRLSTRAEHPGSGIGLAICKKIVERHGGRIWIESVPGQGATFFFTLPAA